MLQLSWIVLGIPCLQDMIEQEKKPKLVDFVMTYFRTYLMQKLKKKSKNLIRKQRIDSQKVIHQQTIVSSRFQLFSLLHFGSFGNQRRHLRLFLADFAMTQRSNEAEATKVGALKPNDSVAVVAIVRVDFNQMCYEIGMMSLDFFKYDFYYIQDKKNNYDDHIHDKRSFFKL